MALAEFLKEPAPASAASPVAEPLDPAAKLRKQVFLEFGAMVALGLLLAGWYVAYRIVAGRGGVRVPEAPKITAARPPAVPAPKIVFQPTPGVSIPSPPPAESTPALPVAEVIAKPAPPPPLAESKPALPVTEPISKSAPSPPPPLPVHETKSSPVPAPVAKVPVVAQQPVSAPPEPDPMPVKRKDTASQQPFKRRDLSPRAGEKYLQIAAYGPRSLDAYLKTLERLGMRPLVGPGPVENIYRILIGPLPNTEALEQTRHLIQSLGIEPILRSY